MTQASISTFIEDVERIDARSEANMAWKIAKTIISLKRLTEEYRKIRALDEMKVEKALNAYLQKWKNNYEKKRDCRNKVMMAKKQRFWTELGLLPIKWHILIETEEEIRQGLKKTKIVRDY